MPPEGRQETPAAASSSRATHHHGQPIACDDGNACTSRTAARPAAARVPTPSPVRPATSATSPGRATRPRVPARIPRRRTGRRATTPTPARGATRASWAPARVRTRSSAWPAISATSRGRATRRRALARTPRLRTARRAPTPPRAPEPDVCDAGVCGHNGNPRTVIVFASGRDHPADGQLRLEIYLMDGDFTNPQRLTVNANADSMPTLSPDGKGRIIFDSNRLRIPGVDRLNTSDLFLMKDDGSLQTFLVRGSSATWSPDSQSIAFHRSASGTGQPDPGSPIWALRRRTATSSWPGCATSSRGCLRRTSPTARGKSMMTRRGRPMGRRSCGRPTTPTFPTTTPWSGLRRRSTS